MTGQHKVNYLAKCQTWRQVHMTRLQPPFFSTGLPHLGQGLVLAVSQFFVSLSSWHFSFHCFHLHAHVRYHKQHVRVALEDIDKKIPAICRNLAPVWHMGNN